MLQKQFAGLYRCRKPLILLFFLAPRIHIILFLLVRTGILFGCGNIFLFLMFPCDLAYDITGPRLRLQIDLPYILSDNAQAQKLDPAEKAHDADGGSPAAGG